jgi:hypothetical protein
MTKQQKAVSFKIIEHCERHPERGRTRLIYECKIMFLHHIYNQRDSQLYKEQCLQFIEKQVVAKTKSVGQVIFQNIVKPFLELLLLSYKTKKNQTNEQKDSIL